MANKHGNEKRVNEATKIRVPLGFGCITGRGFSRPPLEIRAAMLPLAEGKSTRLQARKLKAKRRRLRPRPEQRQEQRRRRKGKAWRRGKRRS
ncbi:hypothetical protein BDV93DRAFT_528812 [Ceratobasidium sp. AG-I]|nr:hypothetical protein BDV93DRAFT_528812 [Ceratobasidium sp. AG-I]